ncbi:MAG TPA: four-helix bundle copper-binding protein [Cytophagaceae bacterium]|nr:four-helix bundle copper-binding protein [Cytophagaceae bacterium]
MSHEKYQSCIDACLECATLCDHCASECLKESDLPMLTRCIQLDRECAEMCFSAARIMTLGSEYAGDLCAVCADFCLRCAEECGKHSHMDHCRNCAETCLRCAEECQKMTGQPV